MELELSHQMGSAFRELDGQYIISQTNFNRRAAAVREVAAVQAAYDNGTATLDLLLQAQQRRADAEVQYYTSLVKYALAITQVHFRKGSLLEYNGVTLAEGPWPAKAYFDARKQARARDASHYLDYGFTQPRVLSRGPYQQQGAAAGAAPSEGLLSETLPSESPMAAAEPSARALPAPGQAPGQTPAEPTTPAPLTPAPSGGQENPTPAPRMIGPPLTGTAPTPYNQPQGTRGTYDLGSLRLDGLSGRLAQPSATAGSPHGSITTADTHESDANSPPSATDQPATGWKSIQH
jgi:hypothetical protein